MRRPKFSKPGDPRYLTFLGFGLFLLLVLAAFCMPIDANRDHWQRLERAAAVAQVISLFAVAFVFAQLQQMTDEIASRPKLHIYRPDARPGARVVNYVQPDPLNSLAARPVTIMIHVVNEGSRTAFNTEFGASMSGLFVQAAGPLSVKGKPHWQTREAGILHPKTRVELPITVIFPTGEDKYDLIVTASCNDTPQVIRKFVIETAPSPFKSTGRDSS